MKTNMNRAPSILLIIAFFIGAITIAHAQSKKITGSKNYITKNVSVSDFDKIEALGSMKVEYTQTKDAQPFVQIYGSDNLVDYVEVEVKNRTLYVQFKKNNVSFNDKQLKVIASSALLKSVILKGSGDVIIASALESPELHLELKGSGDIQCRQDIATTSLNAFLQGSGDINLDGKINISDFGNFRLQGSGDLKVKNIMTNSTHVELQGSGDIEIKKCTTNSLESNLQGSGDIKIKEIKSQSVTASLSGSGDINLTGETNSADLLVNNSGTIKANELKAQDVNAKVNGSGDIYCYADGNLNTHVNGSGTIHHKGQKITKSKK